MVLVGILCAASPAPSSVAEALTLDNGHKYPSCAEIKADINKKNREIPFFLAQTIKEPVYEYGLFFRDFAAVLHKTGGLSCAEDTDECRKKKQEVKDIRKKYTERKISVVFIKVKVPEGQKKRVGIIVKHNGKVSRRLCYDRADVCPVIGINDADTSARPEIDCISPDKRGTLSRDAAKVDAANKKRIKEIQCANGGCEVKADGAKSTQKASADKAFTSGVDTNKSQFIPITDTGTSNTSARKTQQKAQSSPISGLIQGLQKAFTQNQQQKAQEDARKKQLEAQKEAKENADYQARLRLPQCHPAHPYYSYNKEKCTGTGTTGDPVVESYGSSSTNNKRTSKDIDTVVVQRGAGVTITNTNQNKSTNTDTVASINAQKCEGREAKSIIVAKPRTVESGQEITIRWGSACTASCSVMGYEVETGAEALPQPELGTRGEITGKLYNDTRFDLACKDFKNKPVKSSAITVRLK